MSDSIWHYMQGDKSVGPFSQDQIISMITGGTLSQNTLVWSQGSEKWKPARDTFDLLSELPPPLPGQTKAISSAPILKRGEWVTTQPHPWRRYFARMLDTSVNGMAVFFCFAVVFGAIAPKASGEFFSIFDSPGGKLWDMMLTTFAATLLSAALIGFTGSSLGKWLFGVKVTDKQGVPIGYKLAWNRELKVWVRGLALGIPIICLFTLSSAYKHLLKENKTTWDDELGLLVSYKENNAMQMFLNIVGVVVLITVMAALRAM